MILDIDVSTSNNLVNIMFVMLNHSIDSITRELLIDKLENLFKAYGALN